MIHYYCPHCGAEVYWDEEKHGFYCDTCKKTIDENEVEMIDDDYEGSF